MTETKSAAGETLSRETCRGEIDQGAALYHALAEAEPNPPTGGGLPPGLRGRGGEEAHANFLGKKQIEEIGARLPDAARGLAAPAML